MSRTKKGSIAVFFDLQNWLEPTRSNQDQTTQGLDWILDLVAEHGRLEFARAIGNFAFTNIPKWLPLLLMSRGIEMIFTPFLNGSKSPDDTHLAVEISLLPFRQPQVRTVFLISADGDLFPPISAYRATGRQVMVVSTDSASAALRDYCDGFWQVPGRFFDMDDMDEEILRDIQELIAGRDLSKDSLIEELHKAKGYEFELLHRRVNNYVTEGILRYQKQFCQGHEVKVVRLD